MVQEQSRMTDQAEMILDHFPGNDFAFILRKHGWLREYFHNMYHIELKSVQSSQFFSLT